MQPEAQFKRNAEIFVRHCLGESYGTLADAYGVSRARAGKIGKQAVERLICGLPITLPEYASYAIVKSKVSVAE